MIYKDMTTEQWQDLRARTAAWLDTDIKEYNSGLSLLMEWTTSRTLIEQFRFGSPDRYIVPLTRALKSVKDLSNYPKLIDTEEKQSRLYMATVPVNTTPEHPEAGPRPVIPPPETPDKWNRYMSFDSYKDKLPEGLRKQGEDNLDSWFTNRRRLHDLAKNLESQGASQAAIKTELDKLVAQNEQIESYFDAVQASMEGKPVDGNPSIDEDSDPSGRYTKAQIDDLIDPEFKAACKLKRIEANTKYITRKDIKNPSEYDLRVRELEAWGVDVEAILKRREPNDTTA